MWPTPWQLLTDKGWTYEKDGALWLEDLRHPARKSSCSRRARPTRPVEKLDLKDDVLRRANGFYTYFAADIAYHRNKFAVRGFDKVINIWGADHHGHVARLKGAMDALGLDGTHRLDIVLMQLVKLVRDGEVVRMSKRTGKAIALTDLLDEIPVDACPLLLQRQARHSDGVRPGPGRPGGQRKPRVLRAVRPRPHLHPAESAGGGGLRPCPPRRTADLALLTDDDGAGAHQAARPVPDGGASGRPGLRPQLYQPLSVTSWPPRFHKFYNACRIKGEEKNVLLARLKLADTARAVLKNGMTLIGCSAPEKM